MNPERMTVLSMRQKEMSFQHVSRGVSIHAIPPITSSRSYLTTPPIYPGESYNNNPQLNHSPVVRSECFANQNDYLSGKGVLPRACYSPLSVGQPLSVGISHDHYGYAWKWISEVCAYFALQRQTAHYAIQYAHKLLKRSLISKEDEGYMMKNYDDIFTAQRDIQVLGLTCVFIAAKIEEVHPPKASDFAEYISEHGALNLSTEDVISSESKYLSELKWNLHPTTVLSWLLFLLAGDSSDQPLETMRDFMNSPFVPSVRRDVFNAAINFIDIALLDYQSMDFLPSVLAGAAILLADPALDLVFVAQFMQLDPSLLWESKNWLFMVTNGATDSNSLHTQDDDRWGKIDDAEIPFIQCHVAVPPHLAYGLLRVEHTSYDYVSTPSNQMDSAGYCGYPGYASASCISPSSCDTYGCYCNQNDGLQQNGLSAPNVYHFKYGWQEANMGFNHPTVQRKLNFS